MSQQQPPGRFDETQPYVPQGQQPSQFPEANNSGKKGSPCGCFLVGCLAAFLVFALFLAVGGYFAYGWYKDKLVEYTSETPLELPSSDVSEEEIEAISAKLEEFQDSFEQGESPQEFVITVEEINALIAKNPELKGRVYVSIVDESLKADVSFPVDELPGGKGRFFNGSITLDVELEDGVLIARVSEAEANGQPIPEAFMEGFRNENIAKELYKDVEMAKALKRCEQLIIESDRIILKVRPAEDAEGAEGVEGSGEADDASEAELLQEGDAPGDDVKGEVEGDFNAGAKQPSSSGLL